MKTSRVLGAALILLLTVSSSWAASGAMKGTVTAASGRPLGAVWVVVSQGGGEKGRSLTGDDGRYYVGNLGDGTYDVAVVRQSRSLYSGRASLPADSTHNIRVP